MMSAFLWGLVIGCYVGAAGGFFACAVLVMNRGEEDE